MKRETENAAKSEIHIDPALSVEIRIREQSPERLDAGASAQGWIVRGIVLVAVLIIAALYVGLHIGSGWVAADDGALSQSALRVMQGQLPHRDFAEIYTLSLHDALPICGSFV